MAQATIKLTARFEDNTTREITLSPLADTAAPAETIKQRIKALNADTSEIEELFISNGGAKFTGITAASIDKVNETEINLND